MRDKFKVCTSVDKQPWGVYDGKSVLKRIFSTYLYIFSKISLCMFFDESKSICVEANFLFSFIILKHVSLQQEVLQVSLKRSTTRVNFRPFNIFVYCVILWEKICQS
jgi:hypothetical protein